MMAPSKQVDALVDAMANEAKLFERQATSLSASTVDKERPEGWTSLYGFERVANFRDFAGPDPSAVYRCEGGHLKQGLLYRTGHWVTATPADLCLIRELDVRTYLDLRNGQESSRAWMRNALTTSRPRPTAVTMPACPENLVSDAVWAAPFPRDWALGPSRARRRWIPKTRKQFASSGFRSSCAARLSTMSRFS
ncbi:unnamed protein product [Effrenium voratum]|nr:unnamed protein product [Effrenium voratum]